MVSVGFKTDRGRQRQNNEDSLFVLPEQQLYIVADGVGGHNSGELASRMSVGYMAQYVAMNPMDGINQKRELKRYFKTCFEGANDLVFKKAGGEEATLGMATTTVLCLLKGSRAFVVNVGDSRAYLIRDGQIMQITEDHTCVQELIDQGLLTREQAKNHPDKNMITRAIGGDARIRPDYFDFETFPDDTIILCTDGLYGEIGDEGILRVCESSATMHQMAKSLIDEANRAGGRDNITAVCIRIQ